MGHLRPWKAVLGALLLLLLAGHGAAQDITGTISGTVVDDTNQVLPGATVTLVNEQTRATRSEATDARGDFRFVSVLPGPYTVRVELSGFSTYERRGNVLSASERLSVGSFKLKVGGLEEAITVEASGTKVDVEDSQPTGLLTSTQISQIQTKGRDVANLLRLLPGVRYADDVEALGESFGTELPNIGGQRKHSNHVTVDGVMGNEIGGSNRMAQQVSLDAIEEVKVLLNTYRAEYGRGGGAYVQIVTKSGGTKYKGSAFYYGRHEKLNANTWQANKDGVERGHYRFNTFGFNVGGPVKIPGLWDQGADKKLFFFYSLEAPLNERPGTQRNYRMPTELERRGDFSQSGVIINDPRTGLPFPGNVIPANRINPNGAAILGMFPLPNLKVSTSRENHVYRDIIDNPRLNNILRFDWRPSTRDSLYLSLKDWYSDQRGVDITVGPSRWGLFDAHYKSTDRGISVGHTHLFNAHLINEAQGGMRRQTEEFFPVTNEGWDALSRSKVGFALGQFHPELNPLGIVPKFLFGDGVGAGTGAASRREPNVWFDNRVVSAGSAWYHNFRDNLTWIKGKHTVKGGVYVEHVFNNEGQGGAWMGEFDFRNTRDNPRDACKGTVPSGQSGAPCGFANALLGVFREYREADALIDVQGHGWMSEWYLQDTWKPTRRLTIDYGTRFLWYQPWYQADGRAAVFVPERYDAALAPRLYYPAKVGGKNVAIDRKTGEIKPEIYVGTFVPNTGDLANGMVLATDPGYPKGFRENQGVHPEPRLGFAFDLTGSGKMVLHASGGIYHYARLGNSSANAMAGNPPIVNEPSIHYGTFDELLTLQGVNRPTSVDGLERDAKTASTYSWAVGVQRDIGWGTVVDLTYAGSLNRHQEQRVYLNRVPDGAKDLTLHPENVDPRTGNTALPDIFLRPITQYGEIRTWENWGTQNYNALQVQLNRRYIRGLQFSVAYTYAKALGIANEDGEVVFKERDIKKFYYAPASHSQEHNLVVSYAWDLPKASRLWNTGLVKTLFDNWTVSGEYALASGDWDEIVLRKMNGSDTEQFFGSSGEGGRERRFRANMNGNPCVADGPNHWLEASVFTPPKDKFDFGNTPRTVCQLPGINNWNLSLSRRVPLGGSRRLEIKWELYNVLNHTQFKEVDHDLEFDATGNQVNAEFGQVNKARNPRIMQASLRFSF